MAQFRSVADAQGNFIFSFAGIRLQVSIFDKKLRVSGVKMANDGGEEIQLLVRLEITTDTNAKFVVKNQPISSKLFTPLNYQLKFIGTGSMRSTKSSNGKLALSKT